MTDPETAEPEPAAVGESLDGLQMRIGQYGLQIARHGRRLDEHARDLDQLQDDLDTLSRQIASGLSRRDELYPPDPG
ncbi:hypothetical protein [Amycolatopsis magusensis]|uniref:Uncharacterized protein n=1 Tax=Amycolatopsis magusensis TaxID=882444 RepID=A0ABS4PZH7_9PSEU|nr:hypothetical protein [Amycolatopsis magusensis]MBP2184831.1 hypothetical protein [Amycolatopsis magusensis]